MLNSFFRISTKALFVLIHITLLSACDSSTDSNNNQASNANPILKTEEGVNTEPKTESESEVFKVEADRFADMRVLRYQVPGFEQLDLNTKTLLFYLYNASLAGRDIMWDQNYRYNLRIRNLIEGIVKYYSGNRSAPSFKALELYAKQMWFANGIHHHYSNDKFIPTFTSQELSSLATDASQQSGFPINKADLDNLLKELEPVFFDPNFDAKKVNKDEHADKVADSAVNFYQDVTEKEVTDFYSKMLDPDDKTPISHGLNSQLVKKDGILQERVWKINGMYGPAIEKIVFWLEKAATFAENEKQKKALTLLAKFYRTGDLKDFDIYNIAWVEDDDSQVDLINGFIEVYNDPLAYRGSFESVLSVRDPIATQRIAALALDAQWFENNSPIMDEHKKEKVKGISAKVINVVVEAGDSSPTTPIGINLPNANWIRAEHGSKSVSLANIVAAYDSVGGKAVEEFGYSQEEIIRSKEYSELSSKLHTDLHEVIGHASGKINLGVGTPKQTLKQYGSTLEEGRADLVALYFAYDKKLVELGVMPSLEVGKAEYDRYIRNGLMTQLYRIKPGDNIEEDHMRNRQLIAQWAFEHGQQDNVIERVTRDNKTYFKINDYDKLRTLFGQLLREVQRIKSEGDYEAGKHLVETYGIKVDVALHKEVLDRYAKLNIPPYSGFINPKLVAIKNGNDIIDVKIEYPDNFAAQMLEYSKDWGLLPLIN